MNNLYKTKDLGVSAVLLALGFTLVRTEWNENVAFFLFNDRDKATEIAHQYNFGGGVQVDAKTFYDKMILIKREILARYSPNRFKKDIRYYSASR